MGHSHLAVVEVLAVEVLVDLSDVLDHEIVHLGLCSDGFLELADDVLLGVDHQFRLLDVVGEGGFGGGHVFLPLCEYFLVDKSGDGRTRTY